MAVIADDALQTIVVKISATERIPRVYRPWEWNEEGLSVASGLMVSDSRVLTCAHVVSFATSVLVQVDNQWISAKVEHIDHDRDLAMLALGESRPRSGPYLEMGTAAPGAAMALFGFSGSHLEAVQVTARSISMSSYAHSMRRGMVIEIDEQVEDSFSGGPVVSEMKLLGIVLQTTYETPQGKTQLIPSSVIEAFLCDLADGQVTGVPDLGVSWQGLRSPSMRRFFSVPDGVTGVLATRIVSGGSADQNILERDVITSIESSLISDHGTVQVLGQQVPFDYAIAQRQIGSPVRVGLIRDGRATEVTVVLKAWRSLVSLPRSLPLSYFIFGGLVFVRLTFEHISLWPWDKIPFAYKHLYYDNEPTEERPEIVIVSHVLANAVNRGYEKMHGMVVSSIEGKRVRNLHDVVAACSGSSEEYLVIVLETHATRMKHGNKDTEFGHLIVLDVEAARAAESEILSEHGVGQAMSSDVLALRRS